MPEEAYSRFNAVAILDAIPEGELQTALRLRQTLLDMQYDVADGLEVRYYRIDSIEALHQAFGQLRLEVEESGLIPWIHLDAHGLDDQSGFCCSNGDVCPWTQLKVLIAPINEASNLNVIVLLAACYGANFSKALNVNERAPVLAMIGPMHGIAAGDVETDFQAFYSSFFHERRLGAALEALSARGGNRVYFATFARQFFLEVWKGYKQKFCTDESLRERARMMQLKLVPKARLPTVDELVHELNANESDLFEKYISHYFMYDVNPINQDRFPLSYDEAEAYAQIV